MKSRENAQARKSMDFCGRFGYCGNSVEMFGIL